MVHNITGAFVASFDAATVLGLDQAEIDSATAQNALANDALAKATLVEDLAKAEVSGLEASLAGAQIELRTARTNRANAANAAAKSLTRLKRAKSGGTLFVRSIKQLKKINSGWWAFMALLLVVLIIHFSGSTGSIYGEFQKNFATLSATVDRGFTKLGAEIGALEKRLGNVEKEKVGSAPASQQTPVPSNVWRPAAQPVPVALTSAGGQTQGLPVKPQLPCGVTNFADAARASRQGIATPRC